MMRKFFAALTFLTIFPAGSFCPEEKDLAGAVSYFPWVGLLLGAVAYGFGRLLTLGLPPLPAAMILVLFSELATKALHLDGLADTADGFLSGRPQERKLEIMRDSRIGTMGVFAIVAMLGLKFSFLASLTPTRMPWGAALMLLGGRCAIVLLIAMSRYARPGGLGAVWFRQRSVAGVCAALLLPCLGYFALGWRGLSAAPLLAAVMWLWSRIARKVIGGATGDTIGAGEEIGELTALAAFCAMTI